MKKIVIVLLFLPGIGRSQDFSQEAKSRMDAFAFLIGEWSGTGSVMTPAGPQHTSVTEVVRWGADETVIVMEGEGTKIEGDREVVVHDAMGVLYFDIFKKTYHLHSFISRGMHTMVDVELLGAGKFRWSFSAGASGLIRYTLTFASDEWKEIGERSSDGETWVPFFEMTLNRQTDRDE